MNSPHNVDLFFSIMKGIAIISVVIGHCTMSPFIEQYGNQYHLATFFFVSGYFFKEKYIDDKKTFIRKKVKKLYALFVISGLVFLLFHPLLEWLHVYNQPLTLNEYGKEVFDLTLRLTSNNPMMGAMWFCPALLGVSVMAFGLFCVSKGWSVKNRTVLFALVIILGGALLHIFKLKSPYCVWQYLIITGIYYMGWVFHKYEAVVFNKRVYNRIVTWILLMLITGGLLVILTQVGIYGRLQPANINNESVASIMSIAMLGCGFVYSLAKVISDTQLGKIIAMIGDYSFSIMLLHFLSFKVVNFAYCGFQQLPFQQIASFPTIQYENNYWFIIYLMAGVFIPVFLSKSYHLCKIRLVS